MSCLNVNSFENISWGRGPIRTSEPATVLPSLMTTTILQGITLTLILLCFWAILKYIFQHRPSRGWDRRQCGLGRGASSLFSSSSSPFTLIALIVIITVTIIVSIAMLQVLQAMDAMGFDGNEQGEIISAVRLSISHGDDDYEEIL